MTRRRSLTPTQARTCITGPSSPEVSPLALVVLAAISLGLAWVVGLLP